METLYFKILNSDYPICYEKIIHIVNNLSTIPKLSEQKHSKYVGITLNFKDTAHHKEFVDKLSENKMSFSMSSDSD